MDMCGTFKQYQQFFSNAVQNKNSLAVIMLRHLGLFNHIKEFFRLDPRVLEAQDQLMGKEKDIIADEREASPGD
jgi:hypothetical protein